MRFVLSSIIVCLAAIGLYYHQLPLETQLTATATIKSSATALLQRIKLLAQRAPTATAATMSTSAASFPGLPVVPPSDPALTKNSTSMEPRKIAQFFLAREQAEGAGARVRRSIGTPKLRNFSPFLMLDHFSISPGAGFPDHPHRGQETITYLLQGGVDHEDFAGNKGTIHAGDLQFMTAGRGIMHAEMPVQNADGSPNVGMQLWVDLPAKLKACEPRYRDLRASEIPAVDVDGGRVHVKVISGRSHGVDSVQELAYTPVWLLDVRIRPGGTLTQALPQGFNAFAYTLAGTARFLNGSASAAAPSPEEIESNSAPVGPYHNVVFEQKGDSVVASVAADAPEDARFILVAGLPLDQKVVQYGPFVVNSQEEVYQAMMDYSSHTNGFERAKDWESEIGKSMM
ncbi:Pirin [Neofusicoccum parvum]|uniref:Pirin n=1 Tax=Neofusicoccum parvum TaxID=310453 RepID=A0ACB5SH43_9PEZI|nr:Pirin [Neofusicoccum parvum]